MPHHIVALILEKDGKFLVEKRRANEDLSAGKVVFPAGHLEMDEAPLDGLMREMKEELGITLKHPQLIHAASFEDEESQYLEWYVCRDYEGELLDSREAETLIWISPSDIDQLSYEVSRDALRACMSFLNDYEVRGRPSHTS